MGVIEHDDRDPVADLRRIAFLLERSLASSYRVKAFRGAAAALLKSTPEEIRKAAAEGELRELKGIGDRTAAVIEESLSGQEPAYLTTLEQEALVPLATGGDQLRAALRGDCHSHSDWSDGGSPPAEMAWTARELGHEYLVLTDHSPRLTVARGLTPARLRRQLDHVARLNDALPDGFRILTGIEVDILEDGALDQEEELLARLDVVVGSVHSKLRDESPRMTRRMLAAIANPHLDILGHMTGRKVAAAGEGDKGHRAGRTRPPSTFDLDKVIAACLEHGKAIEINSRPDRLDPPKRMLTVAVEAGCLFSIDTDAHAPGQLDWLRFGCERAALCGVPVERVVNAWPADRLLEWTAGHK
jgi:putative hydrolase